MPNKTITVSISVNAPLDRAWEVFTEPEHVVHWNFASDDWECPTASNDLRDGGTFNYRMQAKDGSMDFDFAGVYSNVQVLEGFDYTIGDRAVQVRFEAVNESETQVTEIFEIEDQNSEELQRNGWQAILENYKKRVVSL